MQIHNLGKLEPKNGETTYFSGRLEDEDGEIVLYAPATLDPDDEQEDRYRNGDILPDRRRASEAVFENCADLIDDPLVVRFLEQPLKRSFKRPKRLGDSTIVRISFPNVVLEQLQRERKHLGVTMSKYIRDIVEARERPVIVTPPYPRHEA